MPMSARFISCLSSVSVCWSGWWRLGIPVLWAFSASVALGQTLSEQRQGVLSCIAKASHTFDLPSEWLLAIALHESALNPNALNHNRNGSWDVGVMQINSVHWPRLKELDITPEALFDPCVNVTVGAWLLKSHVQALGLNAKAIGRYHSATPALAAAYARRICARLERVTPC